MAGQSTDAGGTAVASDGRPGAWDSSVADLPEPMADPGAGVIDGTLYVVGGRATERPQPKGERYVEAFTPT